MSAKDAVERAVLLLVSGLATEAVVEALVSKMGLSRKQAATAVKKAEKKIVIAANYDRTKELGTAIARLHDLYRRAVAIQDTKTALQIQRELNKLLDLYDRPAANAEPLDTGHEELARQYLIRLGLGDEATPLVELCRRAAAKILQLETSSTEK